MPTTGDWSGHPRQAFSDPYLTWTAPLRRGPRLPNILSVTAEKSRKLIMRNTSSTNQTSRLEVECRRVDCHRRALVAGRSRLRSRVRSRSRSRSRSCPIRGPRLALFYCSRPRLVRHTSIGTAVTARGRLPSAQSPKGQRHGSKHRGGCSSLASGPPSGPPLIRSQAPSRTACRTDPSNYQLARVCFDDTRKPSSTSWGSVKPRHALVLSARTIHVHTKSEELAAHYRVHTQSLRML